MAYYIVAAISSRHTNLQFLGFAHYSCLNQPAFSVRGFQRTRLSLPLIPGIWKCSYFNAYMFMETANTNGYNIDDTVTVANYNNNACSPSLVQYSQSKSDHTIDSMAPRTVSVPFGSVYTTTNSLSATKSAFNSSVSSALLKVVMDKQSPFHFQRFATCTSQAVLSVESGEKRLHQIASRCNLAEMRALRIMSNIGQLNTMSRNQPCGIFADNLSDVTESSSDDDEVRDGFQQSETWLRNRAVLRCHWSLLQSEMVKAMDCLKNLKPLRYRCRKWRKSLPLLAQGGLIERNLETTSRVRPFEKSDKPRHYYYDLSSFSQVDFKFPGSAKPVCITHPHCRQTFAMSCIYCCPAFNKETEVGVTLPVSNITEKSITLDKLKCQTRRAEHPKQLKKDPALHQVHQSRYRDGLPSCSSGVSSTSSQDGYDSRRYSTLSQSMNRQSFYNRPVSDDCMNYFDFSLNTFKETNYRPRKFESAKQIPVPLWRKVSYPSTLDVGKRAEGSGISHSPRVANSPKNSQIMCNCRISPLNSGQLEDVADTCYEHLHLAVAEYHRKVDYPLSFKFPPSSNLSDLS
ncbi:hypothetical protein ECG_04080 [Echinococcus granulosus]|uniref:Uncharacterized protein n=1 Tax=Echinococcus granulosus TaxID=6210 RepID=A0A068WJ47_ECHGR|nr:hypothetical protein ECG_04080 [Echinococcus granulosus]CDS17639.1 hypothetical protein EgrG_001040200 [Echinococcus granulosus]